MVNFDQIFLKLNTCRFKAILMSFLSFSSQKRYPGESLKPKVIEAEVISEIVVLSGPPPAFIISNL